VSALPILTPLDMLEEAQWRVEEAAAELHHARRAAAEAVLEAERAALVLEEELVRWGRLRDGLGRAP
jgi:hypothetical protein